MVRAWLRDDVISGPCGTSVAVALDGDGQGVPVGLAEDAPGAAHEVNPTLTVRVRDLSGYDDDGNPEFVWTQVVSGVATLWQSRQEADDRSGLTVVTARAVLLYSGERAVTETASVTDSTGGVWRVISVDPYPDRLELGLSRLDDGE